MRRLLVVALALTPLAVACAYPDFVFDEASDGAPDDARDAKSDAAETILPIDGGCPVGLTLCSGACVKLSDDPSHCGACGTACGGGKACIGGACACPVGW